MTYLFAAVFWLIAALINTGGDDALSSLPRDIPGRSGVYGVPSVVRVADEQDALGDHEYPSSLSVASGIPEQGVPDLDVLPALRTATASSSTYSIPVHGLAYDGAVVPSVPMPIPTPTLVETMEAEAPKALSITDIICSFSWPCWEAISVARCESGLNPYAENPSGAQGLFQMMRQFHTWRYHGGNWFDPMTNARAAYSLWAESGTWHHWVCKP